jgi:NADPH-dependent curcumin reductase
VDVFFDNVGGEVLDEGLTRLRRGARVVICGAVSQYNASGPVAGPGNYMALLVSRASMTGFVVFDFASRYQQAIGELSGWVSQGRLRSVEDTAPGDIEMFPSMLARLFTGQNTGKLARLRTAHPSRLQVNRQIQLDIQDDVHHLDVDDGRQLVACC